MAQEAGINDRYLEAILKEQAALRIFFRRYLPTEFKPRNILDFCAGLVNEEPILQEIYGSDIPMISFDHSARMAHLIEEFGLERKSLIRLDTGRALNYFEGSQFDLVLGRNIPLNPNYRSWGHPKETFIDRWPDFIRDLQSLLSADGYLLLTLAREDEFDRARELLGKNQYRILVAEANSIYVPSDYIGIAGADVKDNYVILAKLNV